MCKLWSWGLKKRFVGLVAHILRKVVRNAVSTALSSSFVKQAFNTCKYCINSAITRLLCIVQYLKLHYRVVCQLNVEKSIERGQRTL